MPFVPTPDVAKVELRYTYQGQQCENTLFFIHNVGINLTDMEALAGAIAANYSTAIVPNVPTSLILREIYVEDQSDASAPAVTYTVGLPQAGTDGAPAAPNNVTLCVSFRTVGRGRSSRGRNYILGITENEVDNNTVSPLAWLPWFDLYQEFLDFGPLGPWTWGVLSTISGGVPRTVGLFQPITAFTVVDATVDSQRRRLPGRGS